MSCENYFALPMNEYPACGVAFSTEAQKASVNQALSLPDSKSNPSVSIPVLLDVENTKAGLRVQRSGIYQLSYTLTISLDNSPAPADGRESAIFFLTLNGTTSANAIAGSGTAVRTAYNDTGLIVVTSGLILTNLYINDLIQIVPTDIIAPSNTVDIRSATLTVTQIA